MKSRLALVIIVVVSTVILPGCSNKNTSSTSNSDQAWIQWTTDTVNTLDPDLMNLYPYQPYDQPAYADLILNAANKLKTDCSNCIDKSKNLTSSHKMKPQFEDFKSAISFYYQGADILSANSSPIPYSSRIVTATHDFQQATDFIFFNPLWSCHRVYEFPTHRVTARPVVWKGLYKQSKSAKYYVN